MKADDVLAQLPLARTQHIPQLRRPRRLANALACLAILLPSLCHAQELLRPTQLWLYYSINLLPDENLAPLEATWRRAAKAGYTHVLLADVKLSRIADVGPRYAAHLARIKALAEELHLTLVPAVAEIGYSEPLLWHNPNLAEGVPVRGTLMEAAAGQLHLIPATRPTLARPHFVDDSVHLTGTTATLTNPPGNARFMYSLTLPPFHAYHLSASLESTDFTGTPEIKVLTDSGASLQYQSLNVHRTQSPTTHHVVFNTLANTSVKVYFGVWGAAAGTLTWRNWNIEELPPLNVLRRSGAPINIVDDNTHKPLTEGREIDPVVDPLLGNQPWPGSYTSYHTPPTLRTTLPDASRVRIDWYYPPVIYSDQVTICPGEPETWKIIENQFADVTRALKPNSLFLGFDEIRVLGWDPSCLPPTPSPAPPSTLPASNTPGQQLATAASRAAELATRAGAKDIYLCSDMFDPHHNATPGPYYLVNGSLTPHPIPPALIICNWNFDHRDQSLAYFASRGHHQLIAAYYDGPLENTRQWLASAARVKGVVGLMYCTWQHDYTQLEAFAKLAGR